MAVRNSISVEDCAFPGYAPITFKVEAKYAMSCWARVDVKTEQGYIGLSQYQKLDGVDDYFTIGQTPSWSGGNGTGYVKMLYLSGGRERLLAETTFQVTG